MSTWSYRPGAPHKVADRQLGGETGERCTDGSGRGQVRAVSSCEKPCNVALQGRVSKAQRLTVFGGDGIYLSGARRAGSVQQLLLPWPAPRLFASECRSMVLASSAGSNPTERALQQTEL